MRSEERAGIVAAVLLLLWGTVLTFPLHIFTNFLEGTVRGVLSGVLEAAPRAVGTGIIIVVLAAAEVLLLLLSKTNYAVYIPVTAVSISALAFVITCARTMIFDTRTGVTIGISLALLALVHILKLEKALIWISDLYIYSLSAFLFTALVAKPLASFSEVLGKLLYINRYQETDLSQPFAGFLTLPAAVWGIFFFILFSLPVVYYSFSRKKA